MNRKEFYEGMIIPFLTNGELTLATWTLRKGEASSELKYTYGKIFLNVGPGTTGTLLKHFEDQLEKTKEDMYIRFFDDYDCDITDVEHWKAYKREEGRKEL